MIAGTINNPRYNEMCFFSLNTYLMSYTNATTNWQSNFPDAHSHGQRH